MAGEERPAEDREEIAVTRTRGRTSIELGNMEIGNRKNWEIDRIGKAILAADRLREDEIEEIADAPHLLPGILARVDAGSTAAPAKFAARTDRVSVLKVWMIAPAAAAMAVLLAVLFLFAYRGESREDVFLAAPPDEIESAALMRMTSEALAANWRRDLGELSRLLEAASSALAKQIGGSSTGAKPSDGASGDTPS